MVKSTPAPKPISSKYLFATYIYALALIGFVGFSLVGFGGFDFAGLEFEVTGEPFWVFSLVLAEIFALPFVLRLNLSPLARLCSAYLCILTPFLFMIYVLFGLVHFFGTADYLFGLSLICFGGANFLLLGGPKVTGVPVVQS